MSDHSYGHGQHCYWCGADGDTEDGRPCDERLNKRPSVDTMAEVDRRERVTQRIERHFFDYIYGKISFDDLIAHARTCDDSTQAPGADTGEKP